MVPSDVHRRVRGSGLHRRPRRIRSNGVKPGAEPLIPGPIDGVVNGVRHDAYKAVQGSDTKKALIVIKITATGGVLSQAKSAARILTVHHR